MRASLALAALLAVLACGATAHARDLRSKQQGVRQLSESLREDITSPKVREREREAVLAMSTTVLASIIIVI